MAEDSGRKKEVEELAKVIGDDHYQLAGGFPGPRFVEVIYWVIFAMAAITLSGIIGYGAAGLAGAIGLGLGIPASTAVFVVWVIIRDNKK